MAVERYYEDAGIDDRNADMEARFEGASNREIAKILDEIEDRIDDIEEIARSHDCLPE